MEPIEMIQPESEEKASDNTESQDYPTGVVDDETSDATTNIQESQAKYGYEFNKAIVDIINEYHDKLPTFFMLKLLQNVSSDLIFKQVAIQVEYQVRFALEQQKKEEASKLTL